MRKKISDINLGKYFFGQNLNEIKNVITEFSELEYNVLKKTFNDEKIFKGEIVNFLNKSWNTIIGITNNKIYKIALQLSEISEKELNSTINYFTEQYGKPQNKNKYIYMWFTEDGNIVLSVDKFNQNATNIIFTSKEYLLKHSLFKNLKAMLKSGMRTFLDIYNLNIIKKLHTGEEFSKYIWLRAIEWGKWPLFFSQPIVPILFIFFSWRKIIILLLIINWGWVLIRYKYISLFLLNFGAIFVHLKWLSSIAVAIYFIINSNYFLAILSGLWPLATLILINLTIPTNIEKIQEMILNKFGIKK